MFHRRSILRAGAVAAALAVGSTPALAYIGPGAGFAAAGSVLVLAGTFVLAFGVVMIWPIGSCKPEWLPR